MGSGSRADYLTKTGYLQDDVSLKAVARGLGDLYNQRPSPLFSSCGSDKPHITFWASGFCSESNI